MTGTPRHPTTDRYLEKEEISRLLDHLTQEPESLEDRVWSRLQRQLAGGDVTNIAKPTTLADQLDGIIHSHALCDVLQSLAASCQARAAERNGDLYWSRVAILIQRAMPVAVRLRNATP